MILALAATPLEMAPFATEISPGYENVDMLLSGVGVIETTLRLCRHLEGNPNAYSAIVQFGAGGAYIQPEVAGQPQLLDVCVATREIAGDFGISYGDRMEYFDAGLGGEVSLTLSGPFHERCCAIVAAIDPAVRRGSFVSVCGCSGTLSRAQGLQRYWQALCENMEGFAAARVAREYGLPFFEMRAISNMVENRDRSKWQMEAACKKAGTLAARLLMELR